jgi:5'(3')-deoxyribonucleotidase
MKTDSHLKTLLIDIDGVACDHASAICSWVSDEYMINAKYEDVTSWNHNFGPITFIEAVEKYYPRKDFILNMEVTSGFLDFLKSMGKRMNIKFATSRQYSHNETCRWIREKFGDYETFFIGSKVYIFFDYLIDDRHEECIRAAREGRIAFLMSRPWNDNEQTKHKVKAFQNIHFIKSFDEVEAYFNGYE